MKKTAVLFLAVLLAQAKGLAETPNFVPPRNEARYVVAESNVPDLPTKTSFECTKSGWFVSKGWYFSPSRGCSFYTTNVVQVGEMTVTNLISHSIKCSVERVLSDGRVTQDNFYQGIWRGNELYYPLVKREGKIMTLKYGDEIIKLVAIEAATNSK